MTFADDLKANLPVAMTMAAFAGVAWYIAVELNIRLFILFTQRRGLYFWACCLSSWGILLQPLCVTLFDYGVIDNFTAGSTLAVLTWWLMVTPQAVVLYSRLHLISSNKKYLRYVLYMIIFTVVFISIPTVFIGIFGQLSDKSDPTVQRLMDIWDKIQVSIFFVEETTISILYVIETRRCLRDIPGINDGDSTKGIARVMNHLIYTNILVISLDISVLGLAYSDYFYVQGAYKSCVYGVKLRVEFSVLNRLIKSVRRTVESRGLANPVTTSRNDNPNRLSAVQPLKNGMMKNWAWLYVEPMESVYDTLGGRSQHELEVI